VNKKLIFKISILVVGLVSIFVFKGFLNKKSYQQPDMAEITKTVASFQWCSETKGTLKWQEAQHKAKYKKWTDHALRKKFCKVDLEPLSEAEMNNANWRDLAVGMDSQATIVKLEWDKALQVFRAAGLPFKSKKLSRELLDEAR
jgi:hypothetical protein